MSNCFRIVSLVVVSLFASLLPPAFAQTQAKQGVANFKVVHAIGLQGVKQNTKGKVTVSNKVFEFVGGSSRDDLPIASIEDVLTGADSQRVVGEPLQTLSMFAPYESGRFLALFRVKIDTLTVSYRDTNGGLHGAILTLHQGQAAALKKQMVAEGAKTSISVEDEAAQQILAKSTKEKKQ